MATMTSKAVEITYTRYFLSPGEAAAFVVAMLGNVTESRYGTLVFNASQRAEVTDVVKRLLAHVGSASEHAGRPYQRSSQWLHALTVHSEANPPGATVDVAEVACNGTSSVYVMVSDGEGTCRRRLAVDLDIEHRTRGEVHAAWVSAPLPHDHGQWYVSGCPGAPLGLAAYCPACADWFFSNIGFGDVVLDELLAFSAAEVEDTGFDCQRGGVAYVRWDDERWGWPGHVRGKDAHDDLLAGVMPKVLWSSINVR